MFDQLEKPSLMAQEQLMFMFIEGIFNELFAKINVHEKLFIASLPGISNAIPAARTMCRKMATANKAIEFATMFGCHLPSLRRIHRSNSRVNVYVVWCAALEISFELHSINGK